MPAWMTPELASPLLYSLLQSELSTYRRVLPSSIPDAPEIDSLERLHLASCVADLFCLRETGSEDRLLMEQGVEAWAQLVSQAAAYTSGMAFSTSGSTGEPKACHHCWSAIEAEAGALHQRINRVITPRRVVAWLPLHHLYGFMLGVAYPAVNDVEVVVADKTLPVLLEGDVVVTVPPRWAYLARTRTGWPANVLGVSSTAPLPSDVVDELSRQNIDAVMEIYGSSETGGVATRFRHDEPFTLLSHWQKESSGRLKAAGARDLAVALPDRVVWEDTCRFTLAGRHDDMVSIGGVNVSPAAVARELEALPGVGQCTVRPSQAGNGQVRLKAFVVPDGSSRDDIAEYINATLNAWPAAKRPVAITYGDSLPVNAMGKLADW